LVTIQVPCPSAYGGEKKEKLGITCPRQGGFAPAPPPEELPFLFIKYVGIRYFVSCHIPKKRRKPLQPKTM
jgi:hypothetical protein